MKTIFVSLLILLLLILGTLVFGVLILRKPDIFKKLIRESKYKFRNTEIFVTVGTFLMGDLLRSNNDKFTIDDLVLQDISSRNLLLKPYKKLQRYQLVPLTLDKIGIVNTEKKDFFNLEEIYHEAELHGYGVIPDIVALHFVNFYSAEILYYGNAQLRSNLAIHPVRCFIPYPIFSGYSKTIWSLSANKKSEKVRLIRSGDAGSIDMSNRQEIERIWWFVQLKKPWTDELRDFLRNE